jgi:hypothetical protein
MNYYIISILKKERKSWIVNGSQYNRMYRISDNIYQKQGYRFATTSMRGKFENSTGLTSANFLYMSFPQALN